MSLLKPESVLDGFVIGPCIYSGAMAHIYSVHCADGAPDCADPGFPMVMKVPRMTAEDGAETIISFEVEHQLLPLLSGPHVPRFVAAGDLQDTPYLVMEHVPGRTLEHWLPESDAAAGPLTHETLANLGAAVAHAVHSLHKQDTCHLDLKPANVIIQPDGKAVLLEIGRAHV